MKLPSISKPSGAQLALAAERTYYFAAIAALVVGFLAAHGLLGHGAFGTHTQHFINTTLPGHLSAASCLAVGFVAAIAPVVLKRLVEGVKKSEFQMPTLPTFRREKASEAFPEEDQDNTFIRSLLN